MSNTTPNYYSFRDDNGKVHTFPDFNRAMLARSGMIRWTIYPSLVDGTERPEPTRDNVIVFRQPDADPAPVVAVDRNEPEPAPTPAPTPVVRVERTVQEGTFNQDAKDRTDRQDAALKRIGIWLGPTVVAPGHVIVSEGVRRMHLKHRQLLDQGSTIANLDNIRTSIQAEDRRDVVVKIANLRMDPASGGLYRMVDGRPGPIVGVEECGMRDLCGALNSVFPRAADYLMSLDTERRARDFNEGIQALTARPVETEEDEEPTGRMRGDDLITLRTRLGRNDAADVVGRAIWGVVGADYGKVDADKFCDAAEPFLRKLEAAYGTPHGGAVYNPATGRTRIDAFWMPNKIVNAASGDVFKAGVRFRMDDSGGGAIVGEIVVWRNDCLNLIYVSRGKSRIFRLTHHRDLTAARVVEALSNVESTVRSTMDVFAKDWGILRSTAIDRVSIFGETYPTVQAAIEGLVKSGRIDGATARDATVQMMLQAHAAENKGQTLADVINAITRAAHENTVGMDREEKLERAAGELVPVLVKFASAAQ